MSGIGDFGLSAGAGTANGVSSGSSAGPWGAIIGGASGLLGGALNYFSTKSANKQAFNQNVQLWNMQNAYNSPSAQMDRLKAAGLNPNLVYGNGATATSAPISAPAVAPARAGDAISSIVPAISEMMGIMKTQADTANVNADTANKQASNPGISADSKLKVDTLPANSNAAFSNAAGSQLDVELKRQALAFADKTNPISAHQLAQNLFNSSLFPATTQLQQQALKQSLQNGRLDLALKQAGLDPNAHGDGAQIARFIYQWLSKLF